MTQILPYLRFNDQKCREALAFYSVCLGGAETTFQTIGESPMKDQMPPEGQNKVMHATFKKGGLEFYASDMMMEKAVIGDNVVLCLNCDSEEELHTFFGKLSAGGEVFMPAEKQFWGGILGVLTDKYGIEWMVSYQMEGLQK